MVLIAGFGGPLFGPMLDLPAFLGIALILGGIVVINLFSSAATH